VTWHPARAGKLWLPALGEKVLDDRQWGYPDESQPRGFARLRVWDVPSEGGSFAIVTESAGLSVTTAAYRIYMALAARYPEPFGMAELHPASARGPLHLDLVRPAVAGLHRMEWLRLHPTGIGGTVPGWSPDIANLWMAVHGEAVFEP
jgi:hypothetical protein